jgi:aldose 1-epimerase
MQMALRPESGARCDGVYWCPAGSDAPIALLQAQHHPADEVLHSACFALVPYSNRLFDGQLRTDAGPITLPPNLARLPVPVHGLGWRTAWTPTGHSSRHVQMQYGHDGDVHWPFAHRAVQTVSLDDTAVAWGMMLHNQGAVSMPLGMGWHPCFAIDAMSEVQWDATHVWTQDDAGRPIARLPTEDRACFDFRTPRLARDVVLNHCFGGWGGSVTITRPERGLMLRLTASEVLRHLVVYRTADQPWLCIEPVSHATGALGLPALALARDGARVLAPGAMAQAWMRLEVLPGGDSQTG